MLFRSTQLFWTRCMAREVCPYCQTRLKPGDVIVVCSKCKTPHHKDCWEENRMCTTYGCKSIQARPHTLSVKHVDAITSTPTRGEDFDISLEHLTCIRCKTQLTLNDYVCPTCGVAFSVKRTSKWLKLMVAAAVVLLAISLINFYT